jgi:hypothetical protein
VSFGPYESTPLGAFAATTIVTTSATTRPMGRLLDVSGVMFAPADRSYALESSDASVTIADHDGAFRAYLASLNGHIRGMEALLLIGSADVAVSGWLTVFTGVVDSWQLSAPFTWQVRLIQNDLPMRRPVPRWLVDRASFPNADPAAFGQTIPVVYGLHDTASTTATGAVTLHCVDRTRLWYVAGAGALLSVDRIYVGGELQASTAWTWAVKAVNGRSLTVVIFDKDGAGYTDPTGSQVTADVQGLTDAGDGSGALLTAPTDQLRNFLDNFVWSDWMTGAWGSTVAPLDATALTAVADFVGSRQAARAIAGQTTAQAVLDEWAADLGVRPMWDHLGQITFVIEDHRELSLPPEERWIREDETEMGGALSTASGGENLIDRITVTFLRAGDSLTRSLVVMDGRLGLYADGSLSMEWSRAAVD